LHSSAFSIIYILTNAYSIINVLYFVYPINYEQ
jgi:hypothetical protein